MTRKIHLRWVIVVLLTTLVFSSTPALAQEAESWAISWDETPQRSVQLGESVKYAVTVSNNKDFPATFSMSANIPQPGNLTPGYEPIPDTTWITFSPQQGELAPYSDQKVTVTIAIPSAENWGGKSYECWLGATFETMGMLQIKLDSRLLLSTSTSYARGINWILIGAIAGGVVVAGAMMLSNRRELKRWLGRW
ncbi:MAG: hypothetical protein JSV77_08020 [Dehalococcoidales bacterium]|nr:MAG: hypothetical protein JSV77_08020 [Dehalococcoidales bacterium]